MSPLERRSLKVGVILLLVLWVLHLALVTVDAVELSRGPVKGTGVPSIGVWAIVVTIATGLLYIGRIVAYAKLMGAGNIRNKALVLLVLTIATAVFSQGVSHLLFALSGDPLHSTLGLMLPLRILGLISGIVLIKMLVQAGDEAGGKLPGLVSGAYVGLVVLYFIIGFVGIVWRVVDTQAWYFEPDSTAAMARRAMRAAGMGVHCIKKIFEAAALVIVLRLVK